MASITHTFQSAIEDDPAAAAAGEVLPSHWNAEHTITGLVKADVGLGNVDNTADADKPVSTATQTALNGKVDENAAITGATKTKITYDAKGLVTAGADATTADIADSSNKRYVTDAQLTVIGNTSGTNTGDQTSIVGITGTLAQFNTALTGADFATGGGTATGTNTGDQTSIIGITGSVSDFNGALTGADFLTTASAVTVAQGGTGLATLTANNVILGNGTSNVQFVAPGTSGNVLTSNGTTWQSTAPAGGGATWVYIATVTASGAGTIDFDAAFDSTYDMYVIVIPSLQLSGASAALECRLKIGGAYVTSANYYAHSSNANSSSNAYLGYSSNGVASARIYGAGGTGAANDNISLTIFVPQPSSTSIAKSVTWQGGYSYPSASYYANLMGGASFAGSTSALTGVRLYGSTGNISATGRIYGIKNS